MARWLTSVTLPLSAAGNESGKILYRYGAQLSWTFMRISRTWVTLDSALQILMPEADYTKLFTRYFRNAARRSIVVRAKPSPRGPGFPATSSGRTASAC